MGCVYLAISKTSKKVYVGQTIKSLKHRKEEHRHDSKRFNYHFYRAIKKYGWEDFDWITIYESDDDEKLKKREITAIVIYDSYKNGYNDTLGGDGPTKGRKLSEEHKRKISEAHKGMRHTEESKKKISEGHKGINQTEEHKKKNSEANKGRKKPPRTKEHCKKISEAKKGKKGPHRSKEWNKKISESNKKAWKIRRLVKEQ